MHIRVLALLLLLPMPALAEWVEARGSYLFPPTMAESEACFHAEERARGEAVRQVTGETIAAEDLLRCTEQGDEAQCARNSALWSSMQGYVRRSGGKTIQVRPSAAGHRECVVAFQAEVAAAEGQPDPGFHVGVSLSQPVLRHGEPLVITLSPSQPMYVQVFQWLPYRSGDQAVARLFPNAYDTAFRIDGPASIPTQSGSRRYDVRVEFPDGMPPGRKIVDEYLMVVATRTPVPLRDSYSLEDFRRLMAELPRTNSRVVRKAYNIVRGRHEAPGAALVLLPLLAAACATPAYVDQGKAERAGALELNPVVFQVHPAFGAKSPDCVAVLPLAASDTGQPRPDTADAAKVRLSLYAHLLTQAKRGIRPEQVDKVLAEVNGDRKVLAQRLNCAALMEGTVTEYGNTFLGIYSSVTVGAELRMVRAADGAPLWQGHHVAANRDGGLPLDPVSLAMSVYGAAGNIRDEQVLRVTDDLARRLVSTIPDTATLAPAALAENDPGEAPPTPEEQAEALFQKGRALALAGDRAAAEPAMVKAAALDRNNPRILNALGALAADRGDASRALAAYGMAIDAVPANGFAWYQSGVLLAEAGESAEAADSFYGAALAYLKSGDPARAERALDQLRRLSDPRVITIETALAQWGRRTS